MDMKLNRWIVFNNCLVGYLFDSPSFPPGTRILTEAIRFIDLTNMQAECLDGKYKLLDPGTHEEHNRELIGKLPESKIPKIDTSIFLNPKG